MTARHYSVDVNHARKHMHMSLDKLTSGLQEMFLEKEEFYRDPARVNNPELQKQYQSFLSQKKELLDIIKSLKTFTAHYAACISAGELLHEMPSWDECGDDATRKAVWAVTKLVILSMMEPVIAARDDMEKRYQQQRKRG